MKGSFASSPLVVFCAATLPSAIYAADTMGNSQSTPLQQCLNTVCNGRSGCVGYPSDPFYQLSWVKAYNKAIDITPIAVIRPNTANEVAAAIKCAVQNKVHVQAKSGGHSYA